MLRRLDEFATTVGDGMEDVNMTESELAKPNGTMTAVIHGVVPMAQIAHLDDLPHAWRSLAHPRSRS